MSKKKQGFALLTPEQLKEVASRGGKAARGKAYRFTSDKARAAGQKGGRKAQDAGTAHRWTAETARAAGAKGLAGKKRKKDV